MIYAEEQAIGDTTEACERFKYTWCESIGKQNFFALSNCACDDWEVVEDWDKK